MKYLIDANILISGYKVHYPIDVHVSYWNVIAAQIVNGNFVIIDKVKDEIQDDPIAQWLKQNVDKKLYETTTDSIEQYKHIQNWAIANQQFSQPEKTHFAQDNVADSFLVAKALNCGYTIVTYETSVGVGSRKIKIPDVCKTFGVQCISINEALRELHIQI